MIYRLKQYKECAKMTTCISLITVLIYTLIMVSLQHVFSQEDKDTKTHKGLRFVVPEGWPVEEHGGVLRPIPVEEYVSNKFKEIGSKIDALNSDLFNKFEEVKSGISAAKIDSENKLGEFKANLESINEEIGGISDEIESVVSRLDSVDRLIGSINKTPEEPNSFEFRIQTIEGQIRDLKFSLSILEEELESLKQRRQK